MATNLYFSQGTKSEKNLYEDIVIEALKIYGQDVYYLPRDIINKDPILADDVPSRFNSAYKIEMYTDNVDGYEGDGDLFSKFGVELRDQVTLTVARRRWQQTVLRHDNEITGARPREGDLIYIPLTGSMFEIMHVEHEQPFYQLKNLPTFKLKCEKFEYNDEQLATGVEPIDDIETTGFLMKLSLADSSATGFIIGNTLTQTLGSLQITGDILYYNDSDNIIHVGHIGSNEPGLHQFTTGRVTSVDGLNRTLVRTVTAVDLQLNAPGAQNEDFTAEADFIDFSENNPFGDIDNI